MAFTNKVTIVTGGGSGIGRAACQKLAQQGAQVLVVDLAEQRASETVKLIRAAGGDAAPMGADIAKMEDNAVMFDAAERLFGGVDLAFLNAGILQSYMPFHEVSAELLDQILKVNLFGTFHGLQQARERLRTGGACVVTASMAGMIGFSEAAAYSASKHAVLGLVRSAARSFAERGLRVNAICPGHVITPMTGAAQDNQIVERLQPPEYRGAMTAQQVAEAALLLLSNAAMAINGYAQIVDAAASAAFAPIEL